MARTFFTLHQSVDYYINSRETPSHDLLTDFLQREGNSYRWAINGIRHDDVAIVGDADETFSRDFLRALQICDIPQFLPYQDCREPKLIASTLVLESSPNCVTKHRRWHHPDAVLGECLDQVGDATLHPPTKREWEENHGSRLDGYGGGGDYSLYHADWYDQGSYPLWLATDLRMEIGGTMVSGKDGSPTGYHFHNFFQSAKEIHVKYHTYGHAYDGAMDMPIWELHEDLALGVDCAHGKGGNSLDFDKVGSSILPIYYLNENVRKARHRKWQEIVKDDEEWWNKTLKMRQQMPQDIPSGQENWQNQAGGSSVSGDRDDTNDQFKSNETHVASNWDSSKSAVLGLASGYGLNVYQDFVGSLRATGYTGHIILGIAKNAPSDVLNYLKEQNVTIEFVEIAEKCTYNGTIGQEGKPIDMKDWSCPSAYPDYKITWARFPLYKDWLEECLACTDGVILTDVRDAYFQRDPFATAVRLKQQHPLMLFQEVNFDDEFFTVIFS